MDSSQLDFFDHYQSHIEKCKRHPQSVRAKRVTGIDIRSVNTLCSLRALEKLLALAITYHKEGPTKIAEEIILETMECVNRDASFSYDTDYDDLFGGGDGKIVFDVTTTWALYDNMPMNEGMWRCFQEDDRLLLRTSMDFLRSGRNTHSHHRILQPGEVKRREMPVVMEDLGLPQAPDLTIVPEEGLHSQATPSNVLDSIMTPDMIAAGYKYVLHSMENILELEQNEVSDVSALIGCSPKDAAILLRHFRWNKQRLVEQYKEQPEVLTYESGVILDSSRQPKFVTMSGFVCNICCTDEPALLTLAMPCNHRFCRHCYEHYLTQKIAEEGESRWIQCPASGCKVLVNEKTVQMVVSEEVLTK